MKPNLLADFMENIAESDAKPASRLAAHAITATKTSPEIAIKRLRSNDIRCSTSIRSDYGPTIAHAGTAPESRRNLAKESGVIPRCEVGHYANNKQNETGTDNYSIRITFGCGRCRMDAQHWGGGGFSELLAGSRHLRPVAAVWR
jgi:hypothetical protein